MSTDEIRQMVDEVVAERSKSDFERAVTKLVADGLDPIAARQLINNCVNWPGGLLAWADHLIEQKRQYAELEKRFPPKVKS